MKPQTIGRVLGVGLRVAGRMAGQKIMGPDTAASYPATRSVAVSGSASYGPNRSTGRQAGRATGSVARGVGGFLRPFKRFGGIVFLEVAGVFYLLFVLVFGQMVWRMRMSYAHGPDHPKFLVAAGLTLAFFYLCASSFWRARHK